MFDLKLSPTSPIYQSSGFHSRKATARQAALVLYTQTRARRWLTQLSDIMSRRSRDLLDLTAQRPANVHTLGLRTIPINLIRGSENRHGDFDADFHPLREHTKERWVSVAMAALTGLPLPPIEVVLVGSMYYVRDGHHRISVARALGQTEIEAEVTVWETSCPSLYPLLSPLR
ncbi:MAG: hypothetical protein ACT4QE_23985 [Anaerolineales bacterium]